MSLKYSLTLKVLATQLHLALYNSMYCILLSSSVQGILQTDTGVSCHSFCQGIFLTQGSNLGLLHCRQILYCLSLKGIPIGS